MLAKKRQRYEKIKKTSKQLERHLKGVANHRRIEILFLVFENQGITLDSICKKIKGNTKTVFEHTDKLVNSGLMYKMRQGKVVGHYLSPYGKRFLKFLKSF